MGGLGVDESGSTHPESAAAASYLQSTNSRNLEVFLLLLSSLHAAFKLKVLIVMEKNWRSPNPDTCKEWKSKVWQ